MRRQFSDLLLQLGNGDFPDVHRFSQFKQILIMKIYFRFRYKLPGGGSGQGTTGKGQQNKPGYVYVREEHIGGKSK